MAIDPRIDPQKIAETNTITQSMDVAGPPREVAGNPLELAMNVGSSVKLLKTLLSPPGPVREPSRVFKPFDGGQAYGDDNLVAPGVLSQQPSNVPTGQEANIIPDRGNFSYKQTQEEVANKLLERGVLTQEGFDAFKNRGFQGLPDDEDKIVAEALDILDDASNPDKATEIIDTAQKAVTAEKGGFQTEMGAAPPTKTAQLLDYLKKGIKKAEDFNFDRIETGEDLTQTIQSMSKMLEADMAGFTGGTVTNQETMEKAIELLKDEVGLTRSIIKRKKGEAFGSAQLVAGRQLLIHSAKKLTELAKAVNDGTATDLIKLQFRRQLSIHSAIQAQMKGAQTEAARALQSYNIRVGRTIDEQISDQAAKTMLEQVQRDDLNSGVVEELAAKFLNAKELITKNGGSASDVLRAANTFAEKGWLIKVKDEVHKAFMASILSSMATQFKNVVGNASFMIGKLPAEMLAGIYGDMLRTMLPPGSKRAKGVSMVFGTDPNFASSMDNASTMDFVYRVGAWKGAFRDALEAGKIAAIKNLPARGSKLDLTASMQQTTVHQSFTGRSLGFISSAMGIPFRLLLGGDEFFKTLAARGELGVQAHRRYRQFLRQRNYEIDGKLSDQDYEDAVDAGLMVYLDPRSIDEKLDTEAAYVTLTSELGFYGKAVQRFQNTLFGRFLVAFSTAPTNDILNTTEFIPILNMLRPKTRNALLGKSGPAEHQAAMGKMAFGGMVAWQVYEMVEEGRFIGPTPSNPDARARFYAQKKQPFSLAFKKPGFPKDMPLFDDFGVPNGPIEYVSIAGFGPMAALLAIYGTAADTMLNSKMTNRDDAQTFQDLAWGTGFATMEYYKNVPTLEGVDNFFKAMEAASNNEEDGLGARQGIDFFNRVLGGTVTENLPFVYSSLTGAVERGRDPRKLRPREDKTLITLETINNYLLANGDVNYQMLGLPSELADDVWMDWSNWQQSLLLKRTPLKNMDRLVEQFDPLGNVLGEDGYSFSSAPWQATFNFATGLKLKGSKDLDAVEKEMLILTSLSGTDNYPLSNKKEVNGIRLSPGQQSDYTRLAKGRKLEDQAVEVHGLYFYEALEALINDTAKGRLFQSYKYHHPDATTAEKIRIIEKLNTRFYDKALDDFLNLEGNENLRYAYEDRRDNL